MEILGLVDIETVEPEIVELKVFVLGSASVPEIK